MRSQDAMLYIYKNYHSLLFSSTIQIFSISIPTYSQSITVTKPNTSRLLSFTARVGTTAPVTSVMYLEL